MATIGTKMNLADYASRIDDQGKIARIVEILSEVNEIVGDMVVIPGNTQTGQRTTIRTGLPTVYFRQLNQGIPTSKSKTKQIDFTAGMMEGMGQVDEELVNLAEDKAAFRVSENAPFIEAISQTLAETIFYGDVSLNPERFSGLAKIYSSTSEAESGDNVILAGGENDANTSLWLVVWGERTVHGFFPKATQAGISHTDLGLQLMEDGITTGSKLRCWVDQYKAKLGLVVRDWRYVVRIANIDVAGLATASDEGTDVSANLLKYMIQAMNKVPNLNAGRAAWYCNKEVKTALELKAMSKSNVQLSLENLDNGHILTRFLGVPIRRCDQILNTESDLV